MYKNLEAACGGHISIESLKRFQMAMREYKLFMDGMGQLLAPVAPAPLKHEWDEDKYYGEQPEFSDPLDHDHSMNG